MNLSRYWTGSIGWQEDSLDGRLLKGSIKQWGQEVSDPERENCSYVFFHSPIEPETTYEITINIGSNAEAAFGRFLGFMMIGIMPDEGLEEALFSLRDMVDFYTRKPAPPPARLIRASIDATIVNRKKRPDLIISE